MESPESVPVVWNAELQVVLTEIALTTGYAGWAEDCILTHLKKLASQGQTAMSRADARQYALELTNIEPGQEEIWEQEFEVGWRRAIGRIAKLLV
jgi:hypothetical protein